MSRSWRRQRARLFEEAREAPAPSPQTKAPRRPLAKEPATPPVEPPEEPLAKAPRVEAPAQPVREEPPAKPWAEPEPEEAVAGATRRKPRRRRGARRRGARVPGPELVGRDFARPAKPTGRRPRPRLLAPLVSGALAGLLLLAALHLDLIRLQYALGKALNTQTALRNAMGQRVVDERGQRDPAELREHAEAMGLGVAERVITLPSSRTTEVEAAEPQRLAGEIGG